MDKKKIIINYVGDICPINQRQSFFKYRKYMINKKTGKNELVTITQLRTSDRYQECKEAIGWTARSQCPNIVFPKGVNLSFTINFEYPDCRIDSDAFLKVAKDALNKIVYDDDRQVVEDHTKKTIVKNGQTKATIIIQEADICQSTLF